MKNKQLNLDEIKDTSIEVIKATAQKEVKGGGRGIIDDILA